MSNIRHHNSSFIKQNKLKLKTVENSNIDNSNIIFQNEKNENLYINNLFDSSTDIPTTSLIKIKDIKKFSTRLPIKYGFKRKKIPINEWILTLNSLDIEPVNMKHILQRKDKG